MRIPNVIYPEGPAPEKIASFFTSSYGEPAQVNSSQEGLNYTVSFDRFGNEDLRKHYTLTIEAHPFTVTIRAQSRFCIPPYRFNSFRQKFLDDTMHYWCKTHRLRFTPKGRHLVCETVIPRDNLRLPTIIRLVSDTKGWMQWLLTQGIILEAIEPETACQ